MPRTADKKVFLKSSEGLPSGEYGFGDERLSVVIERNGGINEMEYILKEEIEKGKVRPNRFPLPILSRGAGSPENHPPGMYGPCIRFISTHRKGPNVYHFPEEMTLVPFGIDGFSYQYGYRYGYRFAVSSPEVVFYFTSNNPEKQEFIIMVLKNTLCSGKLPADYWTDEGDSDLLKYRDNKVYMERFIQTVLWKDFIPEKKANILWSIASVSYRGKERAIYLGIGGDDTTIFQETKNAWLIKNTWNGVKDSVQHAYFVVAESKNELFQRMKRLRTNPEEIWKKQMKRFIHLAKEIPEFHIPSFPVAEELCHNVPLFNEAMTFDRRDKTQSIRASLCGYGYFPGWDTTLSARGFALWNQHRTAERLLRYDKEVVMPDNIWIVAAHDCASATRDYKFLRDVFPDIERVMLKRVEECDETGMYPCSSCGADDPKQIGIETEVTTPDGMGLWYNACRLTENTARVFRNESLAEKLKEVSDNLEKNFLKVFYDSKTGFLAGAVDWTTKRQNHHFQNVVTAAMEGPFGPHLLRKEIDSIASFIRNQLAHPYLRSAVPFWDNSSEMWTSCIMQQHAFHEGEALRFGGQGKELLRQLNCILRIFIRCRVAIETVNLTDLPGNFQQERKWQAFAGRAWYAFILQSILGVERDWGGITYRPADVPVDAELKGWKQGSIVWDITITGAGPWVDSIRIDGQEVRGSFKTPSTVFRKKGRHCLEIRRGILSLNFLH